MTDLSLLSLLSAFGAPRERGGAFADEEASVSAAGEEFLALFTAQSQPVLPERAAKTEDADFADLAALMADEGGEVEVAADVSEGISVAALGADIPAAAPVSSGPSFPIGAPAMSAAQGVVREGEIAVTPALVQPVDKPWSPRNVDTALVVAAPSARSPSLSEMSLRSTDMGSEPLVHEDLRAAFSAAPANALADGDAPPEAEPGNAPEERSVRHIDQGTASTVELVSERGDPREISVNLRPVWGAPEVADTMVASARVTVPPQATSLGLPAQEPSMLARSASRGSDETLSQVVMGQSQAPVAVPRATTVLEHRLRAASAPTGLSARGPALEGAASDGAGLPSPLAGRLVDNAAVRTTVERAAPLASFEAAVAPNVAEPTEPVGWRVSGSDVPQSLTAAVAPQPRVPTVSQQIAQAVITTEGPTSDIELSPEELGHVRIHLRKEGETLMVVIQAERSETLDLMRRHVDSLADDLRDAGFEALEFGFDDGWEGAKDQDHVLTDEAYGADAHGAGAPSVLAGASSRQTLSLHSLDLRL